ncbi:MAG: hypothetical protein HFI34_05535 [Lachnospiraceae bacterium]|nr:hypothetical protein [Lachnospiraceae bacterium]
MFQKKEYIFSESLGVCRVDDIAKLSSKNEEQRLYYVLKPEFDRAKASYIPVEGHKVLLRELISKEQAEELLNQGLPDINQEAELGEIAYVLGKSMEEVKQIKNREE